MKKTKYVPPVGSLEESLLKSIKEIFGSIATESGELIGGVVLVDEENDTETEIDFRDIPTKE